MAMQPWFPDAKFGIFLHWGIYAVNGTSESWSFLNGETQYDEYMSQREGFTASNYDPDRWAELFAGMGARYVVLTTKHHDGVALWDTDLSDLNVVKATPAGRDLIGPYAEALRKKGLKVGLYFSHLDWSHPDYAPVPVGERTAKSMGGVEGQGVFSELWPEGPARPEWQRFLQFQRGQIGELQERFEPDLLWFDGDWQPDGEWWDMAETRRQIDARQPDVVCNSRLQGHGDYATPEQGQPIDRPEGPWEFCVTVNGSWGWRPSDTNYKSVRQLVRMLVECVAMGGNLLLDFTPKEDGTFPQIQLDLMRELGTWVNRHEEAIFQADEGIDLKFFPGPTTVAKDKKALYLFSFDRPSELAVKGIRSKVRRVTALKDGRELTHRVTGGAAWTGIPGVLWIDVPDDAHDPNCLVVKVEVEDELDMHGGAGRD